MQPVAERSLEVRADFPILVRRPGDRPLVYLDSGATSQKPKVVIDAMTQHLLGHNANVHRGVYPLAQEADAAYDGARARVEAGELPALGSLGQMPHDRRRRVAQTPGVRGLIPPRISCDALELGGSAHAGAPGRSPDRGTADAKATVISRMVLRVTWQRTLSSKPAMRS